MKNREVLLVLFLSIATVSEGQRGSSLGSYMEDGKYYPIGDDGQYHPRGDDGQYHPTDEGRYIPDYSGLYNPLNEEEYDRTSTQSRGNQYTSGAKYSLGTGTATLGYKPGINVQTSISSSSRPVRPVRPVVNRPKYSTGTDASKLSSFSGLIASAPRPASFGSKYGFGGQISTLPTSVEVNRPSSKVSISNFAPKYESKPTFSGSSNKFSVFPSTSSGINRDIGGKVSITAPVSNVSGLTSKVSVFPSAPSVLPTGPASFGTSYKSSVKPSIFGAHTVSSTLPTGPGNFGTSNKYPTISSSVFGSKTGVNENISPFPSSVGGPSARFPTFPPASLGTTSQIGGKVPTVLTDNKFTGKLSAPQAVSSALPTNFGSFGTGNKYPTGSSSIVGFKTGVKDNLFSYPTSAPTSGTRLPTFSPPSSGTTSQIGAKISTFSPASNNGQYTGKLFTPYTVSSPVLPTSSGSFGLGNKYPESSSSVFGGFKSDTKDNISPYPTSANKPGAKFTTFPSASSGSKSEVSGKIPLFSPASSNGQFTGKLSAPHTVPPAFTTRPGSFGPGNQYPESFSSVFGSKFRGNDQTLPFPSRTGISGPSSKFPILPSTPSRGLDSTGSGKKLIFFSNSNDDSITNKVPVIASVSSAFPASPGISTPGSKSTVNVASFSEPKFGITGRITSYPSSTGVVGASNKFSTLPLAPLGNYQSVGGAVPSFTGVGGSKTRLPLVTSPGSGRINQPNKFSVHYPITSETKVPGGGGANGKFIKSNLSAPKPLVDTVNSKFSISSGTAGSGGKPPGFVPFFAQDKPELKPKAFTSFGSSQSRYTGSSFVTPVLKPELEKKPVSTSFIDAGISKTSSNSPSVTSSPYVSKFDHNGKISTLSAQSGNTNSNGELTALNAFGSKPPSLFTSTLSKLPSAYDLEKLNLPRVTAISPAAKLEYGKNVAFEPISSSVSSAGHSSYHKNVPNSFTSFGANIPSSKLPVTGPSPSGPNSEYVGKFSVFPVGSQTNKPSDKLTATSYSHQPNSSPGSKTLPFSAAVKKFPVVSPIYSAQDHSAEILNYNAGSGNGRLSEKLSISPFVSTVSKPQISVKLPTLVSSFKNNKPSNELSNVASVFTPKFNTNFASFPSATGGGTLNGKLPVSSPISTTSKLATDKSSLSFLTGIARETVKTVSSEYKPDFGRKYATSPDSVSYKSSSKLPEFLSRPFDSKPQSLGEKLTVYPATIKSDVLNSQFTASFVPQPKLSETISAFPTGFGSGSPSIRVSPFSNVHSKPKVELETTLPHPSVGSISNLSAFPPTSSGLKFGAGVKPPTHATNFGTGAPSTGFSSVLSGNKAGAPSFSGVGSVSSKLPPSPPISYGGRVDISGRPPVFPSSGTSVTSSKFPVFTPVSSKSEFGLTGKASTFPTTSTSKFSTSPLGGGPKPITTNKLGPSVSGQYRPQNQGRYSLNEPNGSDNDRGGRYRPTGTRNKPSAFDGRGTGQYSPLSSSKKGQYKPTGVGNNGGSQYRPSGQYTPTGLRDGRTGQYDSSGQGQYKPTGFGASGEGQYRPSGDKSKLTEFGAGRDSPYRPSSGGQYVHDNSGNYGDQSGQYVPDDSGSYVHIDSKYLHDDVAGGQYAHQGGGFEKYRPDKSGGGQYKPDRGDNGGYTPDKDSQSGYKPYKDNQGGYRPDKNEQDGYKPYKDDQSGYRPYKDGQGGYKPTKDDQGGYRPDKDNQGGYRPDESDNYRPDKSPGSKKPVFPSDSGFGKGNIRPIPSGTGPGGKTFIVPSEYGPLEGKKLGSDVCSYESLRNYKIIRQKGELHQDNYHYLYETENCMYGEERGQVHNKGTEEEVMRADGIFYYVGPDKVKYTVTYTADENGFIPHGAHLPTPPPIPAAILKSLEYQRSKGVL